MVGMPYNPPHDRIDDEAVLADFIARHPLATLVTHDGAAPGVDLVPMLLQPLREDDGSGDGAAYELLGHVARANTLWEPGRQQGPVVAVFGPIDHYISPGLYPSKAEHHPVVPTWNYAMVQAHGELRVHDDPKWVRALVARLTTHMEAGREDAWRMGMAPKGFLDEMVAKVVGISIRVTRLEGRFKVAAQRSTADREGSRDGVARERSGRGSDELAGLMSEPPQGDQRP